MVTVTKGTPPPKAANWSGEGYYWRTTGRIVCPGVENSHGLKGQLEHKGNNPRALQNSGGAAGTLEGQRDWWTPWFVSPITLTEQDRAWSILAPLLTATSVSPRPLAHTRPKCPGVQKKRHSLKKQLEYKRSSPRTPPKGRELLQCSLFRGAGDSVYILPPPL